jgi:hypothetical protein
MKIYYAMRLLRFPLATLGASAHRNDKKKSSLRGVPNEVREQTKQSILNTCGEFLKIHRNIAYFTFRWYIICKVILNENFTT